MPQLVDQTTPSARTTKPHRFRIVNQVVETNRVAIFGTLNFK